MPYFKINFVLEVVIFGTTIKCWVKLCLSVILGFYVNIIYNIVFIPKKLSNVKMDSTFRIYHI